MVDDYMQDKVIDTIDYRKTRHWKTKILIGTDDKFPNNIILKMLRYQLHAT